jgi:hypothetical protein
LNEHATVFSSHIYVATDSNGTNSKLIETGTLKDIDNLCYLTPGNGENSSDLKHYISDT